MLARGRGVACGLAFLACLAGGYGRADEVTIRTGPRTVRKLTGTIVEFNGESLTIVRSSGREESYPTEKIEQFATGWPAAYLAARPQLEAGEWSAAIAGLREAVADESRRWAQRHLIAETVRAYFVIGDVRRATATFKVIYADTPRTRHLSTLAIQWWPSATAPETESLLVELLEGDVPPLQLYAASCLLNSPLRNRARQTLQDLMLTADSRVVTLATCQLWREQLATVDRDTLTAWQAKLATLPEDLRPGPTLVLAAALERHGERQQAIEWSMRCPILHGEQYELAAQSLFTAARLLAESGASRQSATLYREITERFPLSSLAAQAKQLLADMNSSSRISPAP